MDPKKIKEELGILTVDQLNKHGMLKEGELAKEVQLYGTTDKYTEKHQQVMMTASVNSKNKKFIIISNAQEINNDLQIDQIYVDKTKASLILTSLLNAFPDLLNETITFNQSSETLEKQNDNEITTEVNLNFNNIDLVIGALKKKIVELESLKIKGYNKVSALKTKSWSISFTKGQNTLPDSDSIIDLHLKYKNFASKLEKGKIGKVDTYTRKNKTFYISYSPDSKAIKFMETDVQRVVSENLHDLNPSRISKYIVVDRLLAAKLYKAIRTAYPNVTEKVQP